MEAQRQSQASCLTNVLRSDRYKDSRVALVSTSDMDFGAPMCVII